MSSIRKIWTIIRTDELGWDEAAGFVVIAGTEEGVRLAAAADAGDEGKAVWHDPRQSVATVIGLAEAYAGPGVVLRDFLAG